MPCRTPAHAPATVSVRLLGCEAEQGGGGGGSDASGATACFEFVRLEHMYDAIFASTNSHCPLWGGESPAGAQGRDGRDGSTQGDEQLPQPPCRHRRRCHHGSASNLYFCHALRDIVDNMLEHGSEL